MVNFCLVANCLNSSRNCPDLSPFCFPLEEHFRRLWKNFCIPKSEKPSDLQCTLRGFIHQEVTLRKKKELFQVNYRNILISGLTNVVFLPVKRDWSIERDVLLMNNVLNLKRGTLLRKTKTIFFATM